MDELKHDLSSLGHPSKLTPETIQYSQIYNRRNNWQLLCLSHIYIHLLNKFSYIFKVRFYYLRFVEP